MFFYNYWGNKWSNKWGFVFSAVSSAIGLANIWKFPYMVGHFGGGAFVIVYLFFLLLAGIPLLMSEVKLGQLAQTQSLWAFSYGNASILWKYAAKLILFTGFCVSAYYAVVASWFLGYGILSLFGGLSHIQEPLRAKECFHYVSAYPPISIALSFSFLWISLAIVSRGVRMGIETMSRFLVPLLVLMLALFCFWITSLTKGNHPLFTCDFSKLGAEGLLAALGHAFFTLSLGQGTMIAYGSYLDSKEQVFSMTALVAFFDTMVSLLAAYLVLGITQIFSMDFQFGPSLVFETLPILFNRLVGQELAGASFLLPSFFLILIIATLTSQVSVIEPLVATLEQGFRSKTGVDRKRATILVGSCLSVVVVVLACSDYLSSNYGVSNLLSVFDRLCTHWLIPLGGLMVALFSLRKQVRYKIIDSILKTNSPILRPLLHFIWGVLSPLLIFLVFLQAIITLSY